MFSKDGLLRGTLSSKGVLGVKGHDKIPILTIID